MRIAEYKLISDQKEEAPVYGLVYRDMTPEEEAQVEQDELREQEETHGAEM